VFALGVIVEVRGPSAYSDRILAGLSALVVAGFASTLAQALLARREPPDWLAPAEAASDLLLITGLVYCTGGTQSVFGFLYVCWIVYVTNRLGPGGALVASGLATAAYATTSLGLAQGWVRPLDQAAAMSIYVSLESVGRHALAFLTTGLLCHRLAREIRTGRSRLRELGELYRKIVGNVSSGLLTVDRNDRISSFNREAERITGWHEEEALGAPVSDVLPGFWPDDLVAGEGPGLQEPELSIAQRRTVQLTTRDGREVYLGFSVSPLRGDRNEFEGFVVVFQDLTGVLAMEDRLRRSERLAAVGQLAAGLAHEIRNPLASLLGAIELLEPELKPKGPPSRRLFEIVQRETQRLSRLLSDFLAFARPKSSRSVIVELRSLLEEVRDLLVKGDEIPMEIEIEGAGEARVSGDPDQLRQVFWNLLINAVQAEPADGIVSVRLRRDAAGTEIGCDSVEVAVEGRGGGIPAEKLAQVFDPFFTTKPGGTGLGLATVHRVVEAHGGSVQIASEVGRGTCVRVFLPAASS
jgi:two-component system sensor histidine kinase PilS (NtrC family)